MQKKMSKTVDIYENIFHENLRINTNHEEINFLESEARKTILTAFSLFVESEQEWVDFYKNYYDSEFFEGMGAYFDCTDGEFGIEWLKRKVASMQSKLQSTDNSSFDIFEEDVFFQLLTWVRSCKKEGIKEKMYRNQKIQEKEIIQVLTDIYNMKKENATKFAKRICTCWSLELHEDDTIMYFQRFDYFAFFEKGLKNGLIRIKEKADENLGYGPDYVIRMFEEIDLKVPVQLVG